MRYGFLLRSGAVSTLVWFFLVLSPSLFGGGSLDLVPLATHHSGVFEGSASEIVAHDPRSDRVFVTNASTGNLDILQLNPTGTLSLVGFVNTIGAASHVRIWDNGTTSFVVAAVPAASLANPGTVQVFTTSGALQATYVVGALPDMLYVTSTRFSFDCESSDWPCFDRQFHRFQRSGSSPEKCRYSNLSRIVGQRRS